MIEKPCAACGAVLRACVHETRYKRAFTCQSMTVRAGTDLPDSCYMHVNNGSPDTKAALVAASETTKHNGERKRRTAIQRGEVIFAYIKEVGAGEPPIKWYREKLRDYRTNILHGALAPLPYWQSDNLRLSSLDSIGPIENRIARLRSNTNDHFADLLAAYMEHHYEVLEFCYGQGLYGEANPMKLSTMHQRTTKLARYLQWVYNQGHASLQEASRTVFDEYMTEYNIYPTAAYQISDFYAWARKTYPFIPQIRYRRRGRGVFRQNFKVLSLGESQETYARICACPEPQGRALALLALLYAQKIHDSIRLRRSDLKRNQDTGLWTLARPDAEAFALESELSEALDECLAYADQFGRNLGTKETVYVFPGQIRGHLSEDMGGKRIREASGHPSNILRRTAVVNMFRGGQKTMGTIVLRDMLNVNHMTIRQAIRMTGESVNSATALEDAETLRNAFLVEDDGV